MWLSFVAVALFAVILLSQQASIAVWAISYALIALLIIQYSLPSMTIKIIMFLIFLIGLLCTIKPIRIKLLSRLLFKKFSQAMPVMSSTEREALAAGTVGWEGELFSGAPNLNTLCHTPVVKLTEDEQAFVDGPLKELCRMLDDWEITHVQTDLPSEVWQFIKNKGFFGMIIPKRYGGLEFSTTAQTVILATLYGSSVSAATTISVPNSLGPAELLLKYGTEEQKDFYLPRLANGLEIPCFALTNPNAGSDAASIPDTGVICRRMIDGDEMVGILLNWNKRYITLSPIATIIGLAFRLYDPENILGRGNYLGISCALIPATTPGVVTGRRHFPLNVAFLNGPTQGKDVFVPLSCLIGGPVMAGAGWRMLMECLSAGRAISLPSSSVGGAQACALASGAYARVRKQFNQIIGHFEGIEEPLARIAGNTYMIDAGLTMTAAAIDYGAKPSVASAILKCHSTQYSRLVAMDAMDIHGGKGICLGPNNYLGRGYQSSPISITVEGANILTRSLIIFGQGAIRCHPYVYKELNSVRDNDIKAFDAAFWGHVGFILANFAKTIIFTITNARLTKTRTGRMNQNVKRYYQLVYRYSANFAFLADFCMVGLGNKLKRKEKLSARLGDVLSHLYLISAVLKRFYDDGEPVEDLPVVDWCCQQLLYDSALAIEGVIVNYPKRWGRIFLKVILQPFGKRQQKPSDTLGQKLARIMIEPNDTRHRITRFVFTEPLPNCPIGRLELAFHKLCVVESLERTVSNAVKEGILQSRTLLEQIAEAEAAGILNSEQAAELNEAELARQAVIAVDDFDDRELRRSPLIS